MDESNGNAASLGAAGYPVITTRAPAAAAATFANAPYLWPSSLSGQPGAPVRVHVVDSDPHVRGVVARELMSDPRTVVAGQAASLREGRRLVRDVAFDVLLVDLELQDGSGLELIGPAKNSHSAAEAVVLSQAEREDDAVRAFELGAAGFVTKSSWFVNYVQAVLQVANGGASLTPSLSRRLLARRGIRVSVGGEPATELIRVRLTARELEVLKMIAAGFTSLEIAQRLAISFTTVNSHVKKVYEKLQVHSRAQAVSCASAWGLI